MEMISFPGSGIYLQRNFLQKSQATRDVALDNLALKTTRYSRGIKLLEGITEAAKYCGQINGIQR